MSAVETHRETPSTRGTKESKAGEVQPQTDKDNQAARERFVLGVRPVQSQPTPRGVLAE
jgi:hypothetical protein